MLTQSNFLDIATTTEHPPVPKTKGDPKTAAKLRKLADGMQQQIDDKSRPMTQNPTPKRNREYAQRLHDAANLSRAQQALRALADLHEQSNVPAILAGIKTKKDALALTSTRGKSEGYYIYYDSREYLDSSDEGKALQALIEGTPEERGEAERQAEIGLLESKVALMQIPGFFQTPPDVVDRMLAHACVDAGKSVLEPSAGAGAIADAVLERCPGAHVAVIERNHTLRKLLALKGHYVIDVDDFLDYHVTQNGVDGWDRIVMNPPFERMQDVDHVQHAYDCLCAGGVLVSIMSESPFFRKDKKADQFREWMDEIGGQVIDLPADAFKPSSTGAKTRMVVLQK